MPVWWLQRHTGGLFDISAPSLQYALVIGHRAGNLQLCSGVLCVKRWYLILCVCIFCSHTLCVQHMYRRTAFLFEYCVLILAILLLGLCLVYLQCFAVSIFRESVRVFHSDHICLTSFVYFFHLKIVPEKEKELLESNFNLPDRSTFRYPIIYPYLYKHS